MTVSVGSDTATSGTDFTAVDDFTLTIPAGSVSHTGTFTLTPSDDAVDEGDETVSVTGATTVTGLGVTGATLTIGEDDVRGVTPSVATLGVPEGSSATYTLVLASEPTGDVTVTPSAQEQCRPVGGAGDGDVHAVELEHGAHGDGEREARPGRGTRTAGGLRTLSRGATTGR